MLFSDDDGRVFFSLGRTPTQDVISGVELDPDNPVGPPGHPQSGLVTAFEPDNQLSLAVRRRLERRCQHRLA